MTYEKTIENLNRIRSAEVEMLRFSNPTDLIGMELGTLDELRNKALDSEKDYQKRMGLKMLINVSDYENYFSEAYEKKKEIFMNLVQDEELYKTYEEERQEAYEIAKEANNKVNLKIVQTQTAINKIIEDTEKEIQEDLDELKKLEMNEHYITHSEVPTNVKRYLGSGLKHYIDYVDTEQFNKDERLDKSVEVLSKKRPTNPVLKHVNTLSGNSFKYNKFDTQEEVLKGVNINE